MSADLQSKSILFATCESDMSERLRNALQEQGAALSAIDLRSVAGPEAAAVAVKRAASALGKVNTVVVLTYSPEPESSPVEATAVGFTNPAMIIDQAAVLLEDVPNGRIVVVGSRDWLGNAGRPHYAGSQAALVGYLRSTAIRVARTGTTVNYLCVGELEGYAAPEATRQQPIQRLGTIQDVLNGVQFLVNDEADYITGQVMFVAGGKDLLSSMSA